jgi:PTH1 family peptidyl-tRNA hydrolase
LGFLALDRLADKLGVAFDTEKHQGLLARAVYEGEKLLLVKPLTFMNLSGECVAAAARNKIEAPADLLVIVDDIHLPLGRVRVRSDGGAGGHNGLKSIIERLGSDAFPRLRLGVGDDRQGDSLADHVLSKFKPDERPVVETMLDQAVDAALCWTRHGVEQAMNRFNR